MAEAMPLQKLARRSLCEQPTLAAKNAAKVGHTLQSRVLHCSVDFGYSGRSDAGVKAVRSSVGLCVR